MATAMDVKMRAMALRLANKFGKSVTLTTYGDSTYDVTTGTAAPSSTKSNVIKGVITRPAKSDYDSGTAVNGDLLFLIPAQGLNKVPDLSDKVLLDGVSWKIIDIEALYSGEQVAVYTLHMRS